MLHSASREKFDSPLPAVNTGTVVQRHDELTKVGSHRRNRPHTKSRGGCFSCKARRVKVDSMEFSTVDWIIYWLIGYQNYCSWNEYNLHVIWMREADIVVCDSVKRRSPFVRTADIRSSCACIHQKQSNGIAPEEVTCGPLRIMLLSMLRTRLWCLPS